MIERLNIYKEIDDLNTEQQIEKYITDLKDRFGPVPVPVLELFNALRLRWIAKSLGFEKISLKGGVLKGLFITNPESAFYKSPTFASIIGYVQSNTRHVKLSEKQNKLSLTFQGVQSVEKARKIFFDISNKVGEKVKG